MWRIENNYLKGKKKFSKTFYQITSCPQKVYSYTKALYQKETKIKVLTSIKCDRPSRMFFGIREFVFLFFLLLLFHVVKIKSISFFEPVTCRLTNWIYACRIKRNQRAIILVYNVSGGHERHFFNCQNLRIYSQLTPYISISKIKINVNICIY